MSGTNPLDMSDEDFLNLSDPSSLGSEEPGGAADDTQNTTPAAEAVVAEAPTEASEAAPTESAGSEDSAAVETPAETKTEETAAVEALADPVPAVEKPAGEPESKEPTAPSVTPEQALSFYQKIMAPFKANGKMIELKDETEALNLMQMGANYTRKMQELAPARKTLLMLQNNNLLDPEKLSFLIDLDKGDPEAVKKFIKDRGIDPLDIDTSTDPTYSGGNYQVSDQEVAFTAALEDLRSTPEGQETLIEINKSWDDASKDVLWQDPSVLAAIQEQRESGVYALITAEMERQITLGKLAPNTPFLHAYHAVGQQLIGANSGQQPSNTPAPAPAPVVLDTRVVAPKAAVTNSEQVAAAAPSRGTPPKKGQFVNFLEMSDDAFLKQMENRV